MKNAWFQERSFIYDKRSIAGRGYEIKAVLLVMLTNKSFGGAQYSRRKGLSKHKWAQEVKNDYSWVF